MTKLGFDRSVVVRLLAGLPEDQEATAKARLEQACVVDWKSDLPPEGHPLRIEYKRQLATYSKALLRTVAGCEEVRTELVGPHPELPAPTDRQQVLDETIQDAMADIAETTVSEAAP